MFKKEDIKNEKERVKAIEEIKAKGAKIIANHNTPIRAMKNAALVKNNHAKPKLIIKPNVIRVNNLPLLSPPVFDAE